MRPGFDVDGVLANFSEGNRKLFESYYKIKLPDKLYDKKTGRAKEWYWNMVDPLYSKELETENLTRVIPGQYRFWWSLRPFYDLVKNRKLFDKVVRKVKDVYFISNRIENPTLIDTRNQTALWLYSNTGESYSFYQDRTIITKNKVLVAKLLKLDCYIEDNYKNFDKFNKAGIKCFLLKTPYNEKERNRFNQWPHLWIDSISEYLNYILKCKENDNEA